MATKHYRPNYVRELDQYQDSAIRTAKYSGRGTDDVGALLYPFLKLGEEAGEVLGVIAKAVGLGQLPLNQETLDKVENELGDLLWTIAEAAEVSGLTLSGVANSNILKLEDREVRNELMKRK